MQQFAVCRPNGFTHICGQLRRWYQGYSTVRWAPEQEVGVQGMHASLEIMSIDLLPYA